MSSSIGSLPARSTAFRLGLIIAGVFLVSNIGAFLSAYYFSLGELRAMAKDAVLEEVASIAAAHQTGGAPAVASQIIVHAQNARSGRELFFMSSDGGGRPIGNVVIRQTFVGWRTLKASDLSAWEGPELSDEYLAYGAEFDGRSLIVARSSEALDDLTEIFARSFLIGLAISTLAAVLAMVYFVWRAETRIAAIGSTLDAVAAGNYDRRVPVWLQKPDDLGRIAQSINAMLDRLADNVSGLKQVSADIAHDLKTPIQRLRSTLEKLRRTRSERAPDEDIVEDAIGQTDTIVRTFQALLRIAQIEGGSPRSRFQPTDMVELSGSITEVFQPAVEEAGHRLVTEIDASQPVSVVGDRDLLGQMFSNLLENAIRHTAAPSDIGFKLERDGTDVVVTITDTGPGIPQAERERVFQRLYRLERSRTSEGSGLGLALVAAVVDLHHGTIWLEDNKPGLRVIVRLPRLTA